MLTPNIRLALTFDDVLLQPAESSVLPHQVELFTRVTRNLRIPTPLLSSAMDTVTEARMAIAMAHEGVTQEGAIELLHSNRIEKLLVVNEAGELRGLMTVKDVEKRRVYPSAAKDSKQRLLVAAAVGVGADRDARVDALIKAGVDVI